MNLNCAVLHTDESVLRMMKTYVGKFSFLKLCGCYTNPVEALKAYYEQKVDIYFIGLYPVKEGEIDGMDFCRLLPPATRVIFLADSGLYAAECFRLDALDYLMESVSFPVFSQSVCKAVRWFARQKRELLDVEDTRVMKTKNGSIICLRSNNRTLCFNLSDIYCVEGCGDYVKVYCADELKPALTLCSMKYMEEHLPVDDFIRVHRSFIIHKHYIRSIGRSSVTVGQREIPIGDSYRKNLDSYLAGQRVV